MKVLVLFSSRHRSTGQIAEEIGNVLRDKGIEAAVRTVPDAGRIDQYDGFVIGGAVYEGRLIRNMGAFVKRHENFLKARPTWLFSSGPIGRPLLPRDEAEEMTELVERIHARGHVVFPGKLEKSDLTWGEKFIAAALRTDDGDFRDWKQVRDWAADIADVLAEVCGERA